MELVRIKTGEELNKYQDVICCLGEFDGIHLAHQVLIKECISLSKQNNLKSAVLTLYPHPDYILQTRPNLGYLTNDKIKKEILTSLGVDYLFVLDFSLETSQIPYEVFYKDYLSNFKGFVMGFDYRFGNKGLGCANYLENQKDKIVKIISSQDYEQNNVKRKISSNDIRTFITNSKIKDANKLLGRNYYFYGTVIHGDHIGSTLGFPTANISIDKDSYPLGNGIYVVLLTVNNKEHLGVANMGNNLTLNYVSIPRLEIHLIDFNENIYNKEVKIEVLDYIREEVKLPSEKELIELIKSDVKYAIDNFAK